MKTKTLKGVAVAALVMSSPVFAQHAGHAMPAVDATSTQSPTTNQAQQQQPQPQPTDHSKMDHSQMQGMDHSEVDLPVNAPPREPIPAVTAADRAVAFPPVHDHHKHGTSIQSYSLIDRLETSRVDAKSEQAWEAIGWVGGDVQKFWWRTEGHAQSGKIERGRVEALYGRGIRAWWDVVAGVRQDFGEGPERTWLAVGVQGFAPYKFEVSLTAYVGPRGRTALTASAEYNTLLTNHLILQWRLEGSAYGKEDPQLRLSSGLSTVQAGVRLRYEINRQFAPYIGVEHDRAFGGTARYRRASGSSVGNTKVLAGVRIWF